MMNASVVIIGGGAAGMMAALSAQERDRQAKVVICEKMPGLGRKVLASGAGRCNLLNERLDASFYNAGAKSITGEVFERFGRDQILNRFRELGLFVSAEKDGRIFPATNQASSVLEVLEIGLDGLGVHVERQCEIQKIQTSREGFELLSVSGKRFRAPKIILCTGGKTYPAYGSAGSGYRLAEQLGHHLVEPVPSTVPLVVKDSWCHWLQGQKIFVRAAAQIGGKAETFQKSVEGELLFTKYGLSGTAILDISEEISIAFNRRKLGQVSVAVDLVPFMTEDALRGELKRRVQQGHSGSALLAGILPPKFSAVLKDFLTPPPSQAASGRDRSPDLAALLKKRVFDIKETRGWNEAEFTAGGISLEEINPQTLESRLHKGLYFAGEILDVQGRRGGYNLAWAWASGHLAGL